MGREHQDVLSSPDENVGTHVYSAGPQSPEQITVLGAAAHTKNETRLLLAHLRAPCSPLMSALRQNSCKDRDLNI
jgi:hypothetical protein